MRKTHRALALGALATALVLGGTATATARSYAPLLDRGASGDLTEQGGAARLDGDQTKTINAAIQKAGAKNVILLIGDGMGDSEITIGRNYLVGAGKALGGMDALPLTGQMTHYSLHRDTGLPDYTPDSAATGTAWATGVKTYDNAVSVDIHGTPHETILQYARRTGRATGNVTTSEIQDATPAVLVANVSSRRCYGPDTMAQCDPSEALENGGLGSISEQLLDTRPDVSLGGGSASFDQLARAGEWAGSTLQEQAKARGFNYITTTSELAGVESAGQDHPLLGLFHRGNMPVKFNSTIATRDGATGEAIECTVNEEWRTMPELGAMTSKAIDLLSTNEAGRKNGFFLQVESASIDKRNHAADACGQIGETDQINDAIKEALDFAQKEGNTLVVVTADHAHTSQIVDGNTPGYTVKLRTADGSDMIVSYGTAPIPGSQQHTGAQVRVAGYGPGAANVVGLIDQSDLYFIMKNGMDTFGPKANALGQAKGKAAREAAQAKAQEARDRAAAKRKS